jgi:hypothetical protein
MPIPKRESGEDKDKFVSRCISSIIDEYGQEQAAAICYTKSEEKMSKSTPKDETEVFVLKPKKNENRGLYLSRCLSNSRMKSQMPNRIERGNFCLNSFNSYYKYWAKLEDFADVPEDSALGECIAYERAKGGVDYRTAYARCATKSVSPNVPIVMSGDNLIIEPVAFSEMDVLGYKTKFFYICPGAQSTFEHLISMKPDEDTSGMIRSAAQVADNVFQIEAKVIEDGKATQDQLNQAVILVDDFYDIIEEIDKALNMDHDVSYMDGHIEKIQSYL